MDQQRELPTPQENVLASNIEQKIRDAFGDYPKQTRKDIGNLLISQYKHWIKLGNNDIPPYRRYIEENVIENGLVYSPATSTSIEIERDLTQDELPVYQELHRILNSYKRDNTYGISKRGLPNSRFYLSLRDSSESARTMVDITLALIKLQESGAIPFWQYKFDSYDNSENIRFDPHYRDKGASPILYVADESLPIVDVLLQQAYTDNSRSFLPQHSPFKYPPHQQDVDVWHIAMETASALGGTKSTPEQGMRTATSLFLKGVGLTKQRVPISSLNSINLRNSWKQACGSVYRDPQKPWITTDRDTPSLLLR